MHYLVCELTLPTRTIIIRLVHKNLHPTPCTSSSGLLAALLCNHVQLGYPVLLHSHGEGDPVLLDQHPHRLPGVTVCVYGVLFSWCVR